MEGVKVLLVIFSTILWVQGAKNDDDIGRPYEFGFTIDGQQHRHEKKDANGIIQGEFGFITADGVYHVTVYATDENGSFRILSMRNIKISPPLDGSKDYGPSNTQYKQPQVPGQSPTNPGAPAKLQNLPSTTTTSLQTTVLTTPRPLAAVSTTTAATAPTPQGPYTFTTLSTIKPGCAGCGYVTQPSEFKFQNPAVRDKEQKLPNQNLQTPSPQAPVFPPPSNQYPSTQPPPVPQNPPPNTQNPNPQPPSYPNPNSQVQNQNQFTPSSQPPGFPPPPSNQNPNDQVQNQNQFIPSPQPPGGFPLNNPNPILNQTPNPQPAVFPTDVESVPPSGFPPNNQNQLAQLVSQPPPSNSGQPTPFQNPPALVDTLQPPGSGAAENLQVSPVSPDYASNDLNEPQNQNLPQQIQNLPQQIQNLSPISRVDSINVSNGAINVPNNPPIQIVDKYPGMVDGLPEGITEGDITDILYKFNYTVGFHGHYEKGWRNGTKIGGYFVNGRDGISRIVTYVADEFGYRPKFRLVNLGLDSPDTPNEGTEKNFGLKSFEFVWYPLK